MLFIDVSGGDVPTTEAAVEGGFYALWTVITTVFSLGVIYVLCACYYNRDKRSTKCDIPMATTTTPSDRPSVNIDIPAGPSTPKSQKPMANSDTPSSAATFSPSLTDTPSSDVTRDSSILDTPSSVAIISP